MTTFAQAIQNLNAGKVGLPTHTENGMQAFTGTSDPCTDLFYRIGAMRGQDVTPLFAKAFADDPMLALRIALWARDVRGGAGERQIFRSILSWLESNSPIPITHSNWITKVPELGRWDDLLVFKNPTTQSKASAMIDAALREGNALCAKWMPRQGPVAARLRNDLRMSPKQWRKTLVNLTKVVEQQMCAKDWDNINFNHVPSMAATRYKTAFARNTEKYGEYVAALAAGDKSVKVNAGAIYPYEILRGMYNGYGFASKTQLEKDFVVAQWAALPNYVGDAKILPIVDVSGSMSASVGGNSSITCMDVALSLGLYLAEKNTGHFHNTFVTFSERPELLHLRGNIVEMMEQMARSHWDMNTNLEATFSLILKTAKYGGVSHKHMPEYLLILSDMQFDQCARRGYNPTAIEMIREQYAEAGFTMPKIVFWNLRDAGNVPVRFDESGVALVSGFSPTIMKSILSGKNFTPRGIMLETVMNSRYDW